MSQDQAWKLDHFDRLLNADEVAALTAYQQLEPVEGPGAVIFPPTFAPQNKGEKGDYNIDPPTSGETSSKNVCIIDTVGAEANRIEPLFKSDRCDGKYADLVPQVMIKVRCTKPGREREWFVNLLDAGHRAGDAIIRFTPVGEQVFEAFKALGENGNAEKLARLAPTSLVFGVWDSRGTQEKVARVFRSVVRATNVVRLTRSAQYVRTIKYAENGLVPEDLDSGEGDKNPLSREGFNDNPATGAHGGVQVLGEIRRDMTINLAAIRRLRVPSADDPIKIDVKKTLQLRRYILGLSLIAATARTEDKYNLREGCQLRQKPDSFVAWREVFYERKDENIDLKPDLCEQYARLAAGEFKVTAKFDTEFDPKVAEKWLELDEKVQKRLRVERPMTKQEFSAAKVVKVVGKIVAIQTDPAGLKVGTGKGGKKEVDFTVADDVVYFAKDGSSIQFTAFAVDNKVEVQHTGGVASTVTLK